MNPQPLPPELHELEQRLLARPAVEPSADLQARIAQAVAAELAAATRQPRRAGQVARSAALVAAVLIIGASLSLSAASVTQFIARPRLSLQRTIEAADALQQLDLPPAEARRTALLLAAGEDLPCVPWPQPPANTLHEGISR